MKFGGILRDTVVACAAMAGLAAVAAAILDQVWIGLGLAAGLLVGALNGYAVASVIERRLPFVAGTFIRLVFFSGTAILLAMVMGAEAWSVLLGVAGAQIVMVAASVRRGLQA